MNDPSNPTPAPEQPPFPGQPDDAERTPPASSEPGSAPEPGPEPGQGWVNRSTPPVEAGPGAGQGPSRDEIRRISLLALVGLIINGVLIPAILSWLTNPEAIFAFVLFQLIFMIVAWAIVYAIGLRMLRRRGYRTALVFIIVAIFVTGLPFIGCISLLN